MKKIITFLLAFVSFSVFSQNIDTYYSWRITEAVYEHFDSLKISRLKSGDSCQCIHKFECEFSYLIETTAAVDSIELNGSSDEDENLIEFLIYNYIQEIKKQPRPSFKEVYIDVTIRQISTKFDLLYLKRRVKYKSTLNVYHYL